MNFRRSDYDVSNTVNVTDPAAVGAAVESIFLNLYQNAETARLGILRQAMRDVERLYHGDYPGFAACDTPYHDLQHIMDVTLASARLMDGFERSQKRGDELGAEMFLFGILLALFHDTGYLRKLGSEDQIQGATFTLVHVSRGGEILKHYLPKIGMGDKAYAASRVVHFTGYEVPVERIEVPAPVYRTVGNLVATGDMLAQMSDRCYLEKCHDRLYPEFVLGGLARSRDASGQEHVMFSSAQDLVLKTPAFYRGAKKRMDELLGGVYHFAEKHFGGHNLYIEEVEKNMRFAEFIIANDGDIGLLRRTPPQTPGSDHASPESVDRGQRVEERRERLQDRRQNPHGLIPPTGDRRKNPADRRKAA